MSLQQLIKGLKTSHMDWLGRWANQGARKGSSNPGRLRTARKNMRPAKSSVAAGHDVGSSAAGGVGEFRGGPVSGFLAHQRWLCCWAWWLLSRFVLPLLRNSFYVTESEPYRQAVFYYR